MSYIAWLRRRMGRQKTILVYGTVVLQDSAGRILLQRRTDFPWWGLPGGVLEYGEAIETCARRELREETGLEAGNLRLVGIYTHPRYDVIYPNGDQVQQYSVCFGGSVVGGRLQPDGDETTDLSFCEPDTLIDMTVPSWYQAMIAAALDPAGAGLEWDGPAAVELPLPAEQSALWKVPGCILPAAVAVIERADGRLFLPQTGTDQPRLPIAPMHLGETVAATAVRAAAGYVSGELFPERLMGIVSLPGSLPAPLDWPDHVVAAVFLVRGGSSTIDNGRDAAWLTPDQWAASMENSGIFRQIAAVLPGGQFVDGQVAVHV